MQNAYDELGRAKGSTYVIGDATQTYGITYENITGLVKNYTTPGNSFTYTYDAFDRLSNKSGSRHAIAYTYVAGTQRVATYNFSQADATNITYSYTYDALGNITSVKKNGTAISNYEYDKLGRLIREDDCTNSVSWVYTYDNAGNLQQKYTFYGMCGAPASHMIATHPYNGSEISSTYTYSSSAWGDLLTGYNGTEIEYDAIGNPLNWHNAASMLWDGRKLTYFSEDALDHGIAFAYNSDGIRTKKTLYDYDGSTITHNYILDGSTILKETITSGSGTSTLYYYYDESGVSGLEYNGTKYTYVKNLQGDVIRIINANGVTVVEYNYDAWGNILSVTGSMASTLGAANPFRYRGYYYDTESGWYYLNSRYYDPQVGRFINADGIVGANGGITGYNMFAYCSNSPVLFADYTGNRAYCVATSQDSNALVRMGSCSPRGGGGSSGDGSVIRAAPPECPLEVREQIYDALHFSHPYGVYTGCTQEGEYLVYSFSDMKANMKFFKSIFCDGTYYTSSGNKYKYYFKPIDAKELYLKYMRQAERLSAMYNICNIGNGGPPYYEIYTESQGIPVVASIFAVASIAQYPLAKWYEEAHNKAMYYKSKKTVYVFSHVEVEFVEFDWSKS